MLFCLLVCVLFDVRPAEAHPVSQGALQIVIFPDRVSVRATVSTEEVLVAAVFGGQKQPSHLETLRSHGDYLLAHLRVTADGRALDGQVVKVPEQAAERPTYELEYQLPGGAPARVAFQQDVLREFEFAPGNPWEATYVVRVGQHGHPAMEGLLLTSRGPLVFDCDWMAEARGGPSRLDKVRMAKEYLRHGIMHILSGYDHLLFITALVLAVATLWDLVKVITAFTFAHSITLTLSVLNVVRLSENIVEPMIAASIVFVALQNVIVPERSRGAGRLCVAFFFGLFHGLGFAGGLLSAMEGMAGLAVGLAIAAFSAGVEIGHQVVVLPVFVVLRLLSRANAETSGPGRLVRRYGSAVISLVGMIYLLAALQ
jgi:hydrogenase/urease accessory protein HupE